jgi:Phosphoesterase family
MSLAITISPLIRLPRILMDSLGLWRGRAFPQLLKAPAFEDGHASNSDAPDEQDVVVSILNALQNLNEWDSTAVIIAYDDSDGWYDHAMPPIVSRSATNADALNGSGICGGAVAGWYGGSCGYGPRLPLHRDLALGQGELRGSRSYRSRLCSLIYRGQLGARPNWRSISGCNPFSTCSIFAAMPAARRNCTWIRLRATGKDCVKPTSPVPPAHAWERRAQEREEKDGGGFDYGRFSRMRAWRQGLACHSILEEASLPPSVSARLYPIKYPEQEPLRFPFVGQG